MMQTHLGAAAQAKAKSEPKKMQISLLRKNIRAGYGAEKLRSWVTFLQGGLFHLPQRFYLNDEQHLPQADNRQAQERASPT